MLDQDTEQEKEQKVNFIEKVPFSWEIKNNLSRSNEKNFVDFRGETVTFFTLLKLFESRRGSSSDNGSKVHTKL